MNIVMYFMINAKNCKMETKENELFNSFFLKYVIMISESFKQLYFWKVDKLVDYENPLSLPEV